MTRVARAFGQDWWAVADRPMTHTLIALDRLEECERIDRLVAEGERLDGAYLVNAAFANPTALEDRNRRFQRALARSPHHATTPSRLTDRERALVAQIRADTARVARGEATPRPLAPPRPLSHRSPR